MGHRRQARSKPLRNSTVIVRKPCNCREISVASKLKLCGFRASSWSRSAFCSKGYLNLMIWCRMRQAMVMEMAFLDGRLDALQFWGSEMRRKIENVRPISRRLHGHGAATVGLPQNIRAILRLLYGKRATTLQYLREGRALVPSQRTISVRFPPSISS